MKKRRNSNTRLFREKAYMISFAVCLVAAFALLGVYALRADKNSSDEYKIDLTELENKTDNKQAKVDNKKEQVQPKKEVAATDGIKAENYKENEPFGWDNVMDATDEVKDVTAADEIIIEEGAKLADIKSDTAKKETVKEEAVIKETAEAENITPETAEVSASAVKLSFGGDNSMKWPVQGNVILNYSMDKTIYFPTLDQYKYNSALMIAGAANTPVIASSRGKVEAITLNDETGTTIVMDVGDGYKITYGQLQNLKVEKGDVVEAGEIIGNIAKPTKYYSVEGSNLYLKVEKDGSPVNPMNFLK